MEVLAAVNSTELNKNPELKKAFRHGLEYIWTHPKAPATNIVGEMYLDGYESITSRKASGLLIQTMTDDLALAKNTFVEPSKETLEAAAKVGIFAEFNEWQRDGKEGPEPDTTKLASYIATRLGIPNPHIKNLEAKPVFPTSEPLNVQELVSLYSIFFSQKFTKSNEEDGFARADTEYLTQETELKYDGKVLTLLTEDRGEYEKFSKLSFKASNSIKDHVSTGIEKIINRINSGSESLEGYLNNPKLSIVEKRLIEFYIINQTEVEDLLGITSKEQISFDLGKRTMTNKMHSQVDLMSQSIGYLDLLPVVNHSAQPKTATVTKGEAVVLTGKTKLFPRTQKIEQLIKEKDHHLLVTLAHEVKSRLGGLLTMSGGVLTNKVKELYGFNITRRDMETATKMGIVKPDMHSDKTLFSPEDVFLLILYKRFADKTGFTGDQAGSIRKMKEISDLFDKVK